MSMSCQEFERRWQEHLDARSAGPPALEEHAASCAACAEIAAGYRTLAASLRVWGPSPAAPEGFADRVWTAWANERRRRVSFAVPHATRWATAAAILCAGVLGMRLAWAPRTPAPVPPPLAADGPRPLWRALAEAKLATLELARETSAPAARLGRQVLASVRVTEGPALPLPTSLEPPADVLQSVGEGVNQGMRPFSGSARRAFGFLLSPATKPPTDPDA